MSLGGTMMSDIPFRGRRVFFVLGLPGSQGPHIFYWGLVYVFWLWVIGLRWWIVVPTSTSYRRQSINAFNHWIFLSYKRPMDCLLVKPWETSPSTDSPRRPVGSVDALTPEILYVYSSMPSHGQCLEKHHIVIHVDWVRDQISLWNFRISQTDTFRWIVAGV